MLGNIVEVIAARGARNADSDRTSCYRGHIFCGGGENPVRREAFVVGLSHHPTRFTGRVIALWNRDGSDSPVPVVCARNRVIYEPELRRMLGVEPKDGKMRCFYEKSCGAVIFRREEGQTQFLLVRSRKSRSWGFPKGHVELGETEEQTARREVLEETGLTIRLCRGFRAVSRYSLLSGGSKRVVFFLAETCGGSVVIQEEEIERARWLTFSAAMSALRFENDHRVLRSAAGWMNHCPLAGEDSAERNGEPQ